MFNNEQFKIKDFDWSNDFAVYNCRLASSGDLRTEHPFVQSQTFRFLNRLLSFNVTGFITDAAKCVPLQDWKCIF